jgi:hypothetical protein
MSAEAHARVVSCAILLVGFASAILIYFAAPGNTSGYEPEDSKQYLRTMELYGGKANVLAADFRIWFSGLWHGKSLAFTVAVLAVLVALAYRVVATPLPQPSTATLGTKTTGPEEAHDGVVPSVKSGRILPQN